jgi:penicillin-binding protein 2
MAHLLGYTKEISENQLKKMSFYRSGDIVGQTGLEAEYEQLLSGNKGIKFVAINKMGKKVSSFDYGKNDIPARNGFDLFLTIDKKLQQLAENLLKGRRGAIVAISPNNGEILTLASKPDYDPREFSGKIPPDLYNKLRTDPASPMYNRAIMSAYPPGSTWKMLVALAALNEGVITPNTPFVCRGSISLGSKEFKCHGAHGQLTVQNAIKLSCNVFFYNVAMKLGHERLDKYAKMFGFGDRTQIDLPSESKGRWPSIEWAHEKFGPTGVPLGYLVNYGIGQGEIANTPLQMAVYASALANMGTMYQPHIVRYVHNNITNKIEPISYDKRELPIARQWFELVRNGMFDVVQSAGGTANIVQIPGITVCGKTGTAQNPHGLDHSWFICFAPKENPQIALCVFVENAGFGAAVAAPIAKEFLTAFFFPETYRTMYSSSSSTFTNADSAQKKVTFDKNLDE